MPCRQKKSTKCYNIVVNEGEFYISSFVLLKFIEWTGSPSLVTMPVALSSYNIVLKVRELVLTPAQIEFKNINFIVMCYDSIGLNMRQHGCGGSNYTHPIL